jgi:predicted DNA-binding ribbon-helix-helix protein
MVLGVTFVRIADFGESRAKSTLLEAARPGGLLAPVEEATRAAEDIRLLGERTTYLLTRLYALVPFQVDLIYKQIVTQPEVGQLLTGSTRLMDTAERLEKAFGQLPAQITEERTAAIRQLIGSVADERRAAIVQALEGMTKERQLTLDQLFKNIIAMTEQVQGQISSERGAVITEVGKTVEDERKALLLGVEQLLEKSGRQGELLVQYAFVRGVVLIGVFFVALFCYRVAVRRLDGSGRGNRAAEVQS